MNPLVSIIINNYNYGSYIGQAIESALAQTYNNCELIIVDDGSTDESRAIIMEYKDRALVLFKENGGQGSAFNVGIMRAKGDYILLLDSDDFLFPEAVEVCVKSFPEGYSRVYYRMRVVDSNSNPIAGNNGAELFRNCDADVLSVLASGSRLFWAPTSANLFDAIKLKAILPVPEEEYRVCADAFIAVRTWFKGPIRSIDRELAAYRVHGKNNYSVTSRFLSDEKLLKNRIDDYYRISALLEQALNETGYDYCQQRNNDSLYLLEMLCAGHKLKLASAHVAGLKRSALLARVSRYLRFGEDPVARRIRLAIFLSLVLVMPKIIARGLLRLKDYWNYR